jgi:hypothetical protein
MFPSAMNASTSWPSRSPTAANWSLPRISFLIHNSETSERNNRQCL